MLKLIKLGYGTTNPSETTTPCKQPDEPVRSSQRRPRCGVFLFFFFFPSVVERRWVRGGTKVSFICGE